MAWVDSRSGAEDSVNELVGRKIPTFAKFGRGRLRTVIVTAAIAAFLAACGDGGGDGDAAAAGGGGSGNNAPTISGSPSATIAINAAYSFTPTVNDADGDSVTITVSNLPSWASFDQATGRISGTPGAGDVGTYSSIRITVSDGTASRTLTFSINVVSIGTGSALLSWTPPTQNTDGSPLTDLDGYKIYWGSAPGSYSNSTTVGAGLTSYMVEGLTPGTWYFAATAVNSTAIESTFSNVASKTIL